MWAAILLSIATATICAAPALARPGDLDPSYGTGGIATIPFSDGRLDGFSVDSAAFQAPGTVVVAGHLLVGCGGDCPPADTFYLSRLDSNGSLDPSFGDNGIVEGNFGIDGYVKFTDAVVDNSNRILIAGTTLTSTVVVRLDPDGSIDPAFGDGGVFALPAPSGEISFVPHLAQQTSGKTIVEWISADNHDNRDTRQS